MPTRRYSRWSATSKAKVTRPPADPVDPAPTTPNPPAPTGRQKCCCVCFPECKSYTPCYWYFTFNGTDYTLKQKLGQWTAHPVAASVYGCTVDTINFQLTSTAGYWSLKLWDSTGSTLTEYRSAAIAYPGDCTQPVALTRHSQCSSGAPSTLTIYPSAVKVSCCCPACNNGSGNTNTPSTWSVAIAGLTGSPFTLYPLNFTSDEAGAAPQCAYQTTFSAQSVGTGSGDCANATTLRLTMRGGTSGRIIVELGTASLATVLATWTYSTTDCTTARTCTLSGTNTCTLPTTCTATPNALRLCQPTCNTCQTGTTPSQLRVVIAGMAVPLYLPHSVCIDCTSLNGTYYLDPTPNDPCNYHLDIPHVCAAYQGVGYYWRISARLGALAGWTTPAGYPQAVSVYFNALAGQTYGAILWVYNVPEADYPLDCSAISSLNIPRPPGAYVETDTPYGTLGRGTQMVAGDVGWPYYWCSPDAATCTLTAIP